ncbi:UNVERIFIED_CONTAM: hypothetical protein FKN15_060484 [Acipenser sinensis]
MVKTKEYSNNLKMAVIQLNEKGETARKIAERLSLSKSTVRVITGKHRRTGTTATSSRCGRPRKISAEAERRIVRAAWQNPWITAKGLTQELREDGQEIHERTIQRYLNKMNVHGSKPRCKPLIKTIHKIKLLEFSNEYFKKPDDFFNQILR